MIDEGHRQLAEKLTKTQAMLESAMTVIGSFRPLTTAVRENLSECPAPVVAAYEGIADMVSDAESEAHPGECERGKRGECEVCERRRVGKRRRTTGPGSVRRCRAASRATGNSSRG